MTTSKNLNDLAAHQCKDRSLRWVWPAHINYRRLLVPNQQVLARVVPSIPSFGVDAGGASNWGRGGGGSIGSQDTSYGNDAHR